jgi:hypothetical protein
MRTKGKKWISQKANCQVEFKRGCECNHSNAHC